MQCESWIFLAVGQAPHWLFLPPSLDLRSWGQGGGGRCGLLNSDKTWNITRINIARPILACLKEFFSLPYFSRTCTAKEKAVALLVDIEPNGTRREEILQQSSTNMQEHKKSPCQA